MPLTLTFKKNQNFPSLFRPRASLAKKTGSVRNRPVQAKKPVPYGTGQKRFSGAVRTGLGSEPVGPAGFTGSGSVLVTLAFSTIF
jgi:hypothetical protein